jgi:hypothetical protein
MKLLKTYKLFEAQTQYGSRNLLSYGTL